MVQGAVGAGWNGSRGGEAGGARRGLSGRALVCFRDGMWGKSGDIKEADAKKGPTLLR